MQPYKINDYVNKLKEENLLVSAPTKASILDQRVELITFNSKEVVKDTLFVCKGAHFLPKYLKEAIQNGANSFIRQSDFTIEIEKENEKSIRDIEIVVEDIRKAMAILGNMFYGSPWKDLKLIGITGTKGKTTAAHYTKYILDKVLENAGAPVKSGILSGIGNYYGTEREESYLTTPEALPFHKYMNIAKEKGCQYLTMEVSSQGLKYNRVEGVIYSVGAYLNIGEDHISDIEHPDFQDYFHSKLRLFDQTKIACINLDDKEGETALKVAKESPCVEKIYTFAMDKEKKPDILAKEVRKKEEGFDFVVQTPTYQEEFSLPMTGLFNVSNALCAITIAYGLGIDPKYIKEGLASGKVDGRMELFLSKDKKRTVVVDYAHNKMSFETLFESTAKEYPNRKIYIVFGCVGKKALGRRQELGEIAAKYATKVFITEDDHGEEPLENICKEVATYVEAKGCSSEIILDRREAIKKAIKLLDEKSILLVAGKGRETRQKRGIEQVTTPSDVDYVVELIDNEDYGN